MEAAKIVDETLPGQLIGFRIGDDTLEFLLSKCKKS